MIEQGRRLLDLSVMEMLNYVFTLLMKDRDDEGRRKMMALLEGRIGENGGEIVDDEELPESMRGLEAPSWWNGEHDPFADQQRVASSTARTTASGVSTT